MSGLCVSRRKSFCVPQFKYQLLASLQKPVLLSTRSQPASPHDFPVIPPLPPFAWMHAATERRRGPKCFSAPAREHRLICAPEPGFLAQTRRNLKTLNMDECKTALYKATTDDPLPPNEKHVRARRRRRRRWMRSSRSGCRRAARRPRRRSQPRRCSCSAASRVKGTSRRSPNRCVSSLRVCCEPQC